MKQEDDRPFWCPSDEKPKTEDEPEFDFDPEIFDVNNWFD